MNLGKLHGLGDDVDTAGPDQLVGAHAPDVYCRRPAVHLALDFILDRGVVLVDVGVNAGDDAHVAAELLVVLAHIILARLKNHVDPLLFGKLERFHKLGFGHIGPEQIGNVLQVAAMHVAADEVSAQKYAAELRLAQHAAGHAISRLLAATGGSRGLRTCGRLGHFRAYGRLAGGQCRCRAANETAPRDR